MGRGIRFGRAFDAQDIVRQKYRALGFWGALLNIAIVVCALIALVTQPLLWSLVGLAIIVRVVLAVAKLYYEQIYDIRR